MKKLLLFLMYPFIVFSFTENNDSIDYILKKLAENSNDLTRVEYNLQRIDTFASGGVRNSEGYALIERSKQDSLFGFVFFGERFDIDYQSIYDGKYEFWINRSEKSYTISKPGYGFLGSPGGQMVVRELFFPDSIYKSVKLSDTKDSYLVEYQYEDDTVYSVTKDFKLIEINKNDFLPRKITISYEALGNRAVHQMLISNLKINSGINKSLDQVKEELSNFKLVEEKTIPFLDMVNSIAPVYKLADLFHSDNFIEFPKGILTLLDFWEVWCGPCLGSLPEVEKISKRFSESIEVIGIVTNDTENAKKLIIQKNLSFINLIGNENILKKYEITGIPRYILIDKNGIVRKDYLGFSPQIEEDIVQLLKE